VTCDSVVVLFQELGRPVFHDGAFRVTHIILCFCCIMTKVMKRNFLGFLLEHSLMLLR